MDRGDEIIFVGSYKNFKLEVRFGLSGKDDSYVKDALAYVSSAIEPHAFGFSGIDGGKIDSFASPSGKGLGAVYGFLDSKSPSAIKEALLNSCPKPELLPAAESWMFNKLLSKAAVSFKIECSTSMKPEEEKAEDFIGFVGKYKQWVAIKKLGLDGVKDYEVSGILSGINNTIVNKGFDFSTGKKDTTIVDSVTKGKRRTYGNASASLKELEQKISGQDAYAVCKVLETIGYRPYASPGMLTNAYPDIKPPKVKGRKPKG